VFAITQLSEYLGEHLHAHPVRAALQTLVLYLAVWWAWNYAAWATNWVDPERPPTHRLLAWSAIAGVGWIAGAFIHGDARLFVWAVALALDLSASMHGFRLPASPMGMGEWTLAGAHLAERMQLVLLIALGESVLRVGATFAKKSGSPPVDTAFLVGFIATASPWGRLFPAARPNAAPTRSPAPPRTPRDSAGRAMPKRTRSWSAV
jgi:low temperature requirement protein LtrA